MTSNAISQNHDRLFRISNLTDPITRHVRSANSWLSAFGCFVRTDIPFTSLQIALHSLLSLTKVIFGIPIYQMHSSSSFIYFLLLLSILFFLIYSTPPFCSTFFFLYIKKHSMYFNFIK